MKWIFIPLLKALAYFIAALPRPCQIKLGRGLGLLLKAFSFRKTIILNNLHLAYPNLSQQERDKLIDRNYFNYGQVFLEFLISFGPYAEFLQKHCRVEGEQHLGNALAAGKGALVFTAHLSNWELLPAFTAYNLKFPVTMVTKHLKPEWLHQFVEKERAKMNVRMAFEPRTMSTILKSLKSGGAVGFVVDQYMGAPFAARVPFFGIPVGSQIALATIALRTGVPVIPGIVTRSDNGDYIIRFEPEIPFDYADGNKDQAILQNTANYVAYSEQWVRQYPEQWLWIHRRWKGNLQPLAQNSVGELVK